jgi:hypothetical protein
MGSPDMLVSKGIISPEVREQIRREGASTAFLRESVAKDLKRIRKDPIALTLEQRLWLENQIYGYTGNEIPLSDLVRPLRPFKSRMLEGISAVFNKAKIALSPKPREGVYRPVGVSFNSRVSAGR